MIRPFFWQKKVCANSATKCHVVPNLYYLDNQLVIKNAWHDLAQTKLCSKKMHISLFINQLQKQNFS